MKMLKIIFFVAGIFFYGHFAFAEQINLPKDENGWTIFTPSDDSRIMYISLDGNDSTGTIYDDDDVLLGGNPFNPTGTINSFATYAAAYANTREGYPDWILFKRGETFTPSITTAFINNPRSGRSSTEPFLIGSYGNSGISPIIQTGNQIAVRITTGISYLAISGLDFYSQTRDPDNGGVLSSGSVGLSVYVGEFGGPNYNVDAVLFEGCKFRFYEGNNLQNGWTGDMNFEIRRCTFTDNYSETSHSQGIFAYKVNNLIFEENIMIHNGWYQQQIVPGSNVQDDGQATQFNHNIYWASVKNPVIRNNLFIDASSGGIKLTGQYKTESTTISDNLFIGNEIPISMGNNYQEPEHAYRFPNTIIENNVITHAGRLRPTNRNIGWGFWLCGLDGGNVSDNLLINSEPTVTNNNAFSINSDESRGISWNNNIVYNYGISSVFSVSASSVGSSNMSFANNIIQLPNILNGNVVSVGYDIRDEWSFSNNIYFADSQTFNANGSDMDLAAWNSWSGDNSTWSEYGFPDNNRDVDTYMASIGETGTIDSFVTKARTQDRYSWDSRYVASTVNNWIRDGFFESSDTTSPSAPINLNVL